MVREYRQGDLEAVVALFGRSVHKVASRHYSPVQIAAWAPRIPDWPAWSRSLAEGAVFVCERKGRIAGFIRMEDNGYLDLLYVDPDFQRQGVARELLDRVLAWASDQCISRISSDVSITARPFFEQAGFRVVTPQIVEWNGASFHNFRMERSLTQSP